MVWKGTQPLFWTIVNAGFAILPATIIMHYLHRLTGWRQLAVLIISPIGITMGHIGIGILFYNAVNSDWGRVAIELSGIASAVFFLVMVKLCIEDLLERQKVYPALQ